jgi:hypothetical protein
MSEQQTIDESSTSIDAIAALQKQYPNVSADAARILANPRNGYWLPRDTNERVEAVAFAEDEAYFLAGPFDGKYGLVYVQHQPDAAPLAEQLEKLERSFTTECSTTYMPYSARSRLDKVYPQGTLFHWDPVDRVSYADVDIPYLAKDLRARLETKGNRCQLFAQTPEGKVEILEQLTAEEQDAYAAAKHAAAQRCMAEVVQTGLYAERPYLVRLQGTDDASWSVSRATLAEVEEVINALRVSGQDAVYEHMFFTN